MAVSEFKTHSLYYEKPGKVSIREGRISQPEEKEIVIKTIISAISAGTERLLYHGKISEGISLDDSINELNQVFRYPVQYGYQNVGRVIDVGKDVPKNMVGKIVFSFHPHESIYKKKYDDIIILPNEMNPRDAIFTASMETAIMLLMDGNPNIGERVGVVGQGVIGLLVVALLKEYPLKEIISFDTSVFRRKMSISCGAHKSYDQKKDDEEHEELDCVYELSGSATGLELAIAHTGYSGRILIGSWYGDEPMNIHLNTRFHRKRQKIISSQVSTIAPQHSGMWNKKRRLNYALEMINKIRPSRFITHTFGLHETQRAFTMLEQESRDYMQIVFTYE